MTARDGKVEMGKLPSQPPNNNEEPEDNYEKEDVP